MTFFRFIAISFGSFQNWTQFGRSTIIIIHFRVSDYFISWLSGFASPFITDRRFVSKSLFYHFVWVEFAFFHSPGCHFGKTNIIFLNKKKIGIGWFTCGHLKLLDMWTVDIGYNIPWKISQKPKLGILIDKINPLTNSCWLLMDFKQYR